MAVTNDPHGILRHRVVETVLSSEGTSDRALRRDAFDGARVPPELATFIEKVRANAYKVTDADVARLQQTYTDDQLFEIIVAASVGAAERRLVAGLEALDDA